MMERVTLKLCMLLMAVLTLTACSKEEDTITPLSEIIDPARYNNGQPANQNGVNGQTAYQNGTGEKNNNGHSNAFSPLDDMQGEYDGEWSINGQKVDAEEVSDFKLPLFYNGLTISFTTFPYKAIALRYGLQSMALNAQPFEPHITTPYFYLSNELWTNEMNLLYDILFYGDEELKNCQFELCSFLKLVGYSDHLLYFELTSQPPVVPYIPNMKDASDSNSPFFRLPYIVTLDDGSYYAIVLDVLYSMSTLAFDSSAKTIHFTCTIPQIEIYDQEGNKTINKLDPEMILTFTSTQKTKAGESGD